MKKVVLFLLVISMLTLAVAVSCGANPEKQIKGTWAYGDGLTSQVYTFNGDGTGTLRIAELTETAVAYTITEDSITINGLVFSYTIEDDVLTLKQNLTDVSVSYTKQK